MTPALKASSEYVDPRVRRTRQMLEQAMAGLLATTPFDKISVADIADAATLNRATFYGHFLDKFDLLTGMVASRFEDLLQQRQVVFDGTCPSAMYGIVLALCDYLATMPYCAEQRHMEQHMELALVGIVRRMLTEGLLQHRPKGNLSPELIAAALAGAIYSAVKEWARTPERGRAEPVARAITSLLAPIMMGREP